MGVACAAFDPSAKSKIGLQECIGPMCTLSQNGYGTLFLGWFMLFTAHNYPPLSTTDRDRTSCLGLRTHQSALASVSTDVISQCKPNCQAHYPVKLLLSPIPSNPVTPHKSIIPGSPLCPSTSMTAHIPCTPHASETKHLPFWLLQS